MLVVKKFGGSSVADKEKIFNVARRCIEDYEKGYDVVVVLSAMGKTTDGLLEKAHEITETPSKREMDMLLVTGEQISVALMAMAFQSLGVQAVSLNASQVAMRTTSAYGQAKLKRIETERIRNELDARKIVVITGFQGINKYDDMTTLGRGGSDTTAVALAVALHADLCEIYTDVDGVYTADPRIVPNARKLSEVSYDEMLEFASLGAKVLHNRSVEMAKRYGVKLMVLSSMTRAEGTIIKEKTTMEKMLVSGVAADKNTARVSVLGVSDEPGIAFRLFNLLARHQINVDIIIQSVGRDNKKDISFTVARTDLQETLELINVHLEMLTAQSVSSDDTVAKISIIGAGMTSNPGVAAKMFEAMSSANINIKMIATSEIRITVLIDEVDTNRAMRVVHDAFALAD
ncbi:aspartate kinase [[Clostridium] symbiosum]|uniref:aspartate kinase n=1 Tax=Clostridium symbiosum TaxID=1512 RepID=UPI001D095521|nr:aspartate kinase [[Clostridium] symbiosum]MCB6610350.1 aspartate kinase [[Clostridium] symbiosum]MCB6931986.1 aspartate kinase [[Clostridium] symbiosum]